MSDEELSQIRERCLRSQPQDDGTLSFNALLESAMDVPALCVEVQRLKEQMKHMAVPPIHEVMKR